MGVLDFLDPFKVNGVKYKNAADAVRARRQEALKGIVENRGLRNRLWNLIANKKDKKKAADQYQSMLNGGDGYETY